MFSSRIFISSVWTIALLLPNVGQAQETWTFDPSFQRTPLLVTSEAATGVKVLSSGKVLIHSINGAIVSGADGQHIGALVRIDPNTGALDPTWHPDPTSIDAFLGIAEAPDGKIYFSTSLIGEVADSNDPAINRLIRLNTDGSRDTSFNSPIFGTLARFVAVQPGGKIIVCAGGTNVGGVLQAGSIVQTVRLNTDGSLDSTFQSPNFQVNSTEPPITVTNYRDSGLFGNPVVDPATGKIYFCGRFKFVNGQACQGIVRCNLDGTLDSSFLPAGLGSNYTPFARAIVLQAGGKVVLGGINLRTAAGGATRYALLRFNSDGTLDPSFNLFPTTNSSGTALVPGYFGPRHIEATPDGMILTSDVRVLRFLADGTLDPAFTPLDYSSPFFTPNTGSVAAFRFDLDPNTGAAFLQDQGSPYARLNGVPVGNIVKLKADGTIDAQFISPVVNSEDFAPDVQIGVSGVVYISGYHTTFGNTANATIARLLADGTRDPSYSLDALPFVDKQAAGLALLPDSSAYVTYYSGSFNGGYSFSNLVRLLPSGALDTIFRPSSALQDSLNVNAFDGNDTAKTTVPGISAGPLGTAYLFPEGGRVTINANGNLKPTRVNANGTEDTTVPALGFPTGEVIRDSSGITGGSTGYLRRLAQTTDEGFIILASVAPFPTSTGAPYNYRVIKVGADGSLDTNFNSPSLTSTVSPFRDATTALFDPVTGITRQPPNGFYREGQFPFPVSSATVLGDSSVILAGNFKIGSTTYSLSKLTAAGTLAPLFNPPVPSNSAHPTRPAIVTSARVAPDGKIWILGRFDTLANHSAPGVARLNADGTLDNTFQLTQVGYYDSYGDYADVVFVNRNTAFLVGTFRRQGETLPFPVTRIVNASPPVITSPSSAMGTVGQPFTYMIVSSNSPTSFAASNLPPGLTLDSSVGVLSGKPTQAGVAQVLISATNSFGTGSQNLTLDIAPAAGGGGGSAPQLLGATSITARTGQPFTFQVRATGVTSSATIDASGLPPGLTIDRTTGVISGIPTQDGSFAVSLTLSDVGRTVKGTLELTFVSDPGFPVIVSPTSANVASGQPFSYTILAPSAAGPSDPTIYSIIGTLPPGLIFDPKTGTISGTFAGQMFTRRLDQDGDGNGNGVVRVDAGAPNIVGVIQLVATNSHGSASTQLILLTAKRVSAGNISTRMKVDTGDNVLIGGFIISGTAPKKVIVRAIGPSLTQYNVPGVLDDPSLTLFNSLGQSLRSNDNWQDSQAAEITASGKAPGDPHEAALVATLEPGAYTTIVTGNGGTTGVALVEVYDLDPAADSQMANISTRGKVLTGDDVMIGGFILSGANTANVVVRAIGPSLTQYNVPGALDDPVLDLFDSNGNHLAGNDNWRSDQEQALLTVGKAPSDDREAALLLNAPGGAYTAIVRGKDGSTGVALVEVYVLQ